MLSARLILKKDSRGLVSFTTHQNWTGIVLPQGDCVITSDGMSTEDILRIAKDVLEERGLEDVIVASTRGDTGMAAARLFKGLEMNLVVVAHSVGFRENNTNEFRVDAKKEIGELGGSVLFSTMPFPSINDAIRTKMGSSIETLIADALRMIGQGTKVCAEIVAMACDAGLVVAGKSVLAIAGTGRGADTVMIIKSANSRRFFDMKVLDVIAKPQRL